MVDLTIEAKKCGATRLRIRDKASTMVNCKIKNRMMLIGVKKWGKYRLFFTWVTL
jgi:hypothetical protein